MSPKNKTKNESHLRASPSVKVVMTLVSIIFKTFESLTKFIAVATGNR